jgi:hypothetical protein
MRKMTLAGLCLVVAASCWLAGSLAGPDGLRRALASLGACAAFAGAAACYRVVRHITHRSSAAGAMALLGVAASAWVVEATFRATYPRLPGAAADPVTLTALVAGGTGLALLTTAAWRAGWLGPTVGSLLVAAALIGAITGRPAVPYLISAGPLGVALLVAGAPRPVRRPTAFAYAAGITGTLSNLLLIVFFAVQFGDPEQPVSFGTANDVVGSLASALMIPVAVALTSHLPATSLARRVQAAGIAAMAASAVVGPLLVTGALLFEVSTAISIAALLVLAGWLVVVNRWLRRSAAVPARVARLGEWSGLAFASGAAVVGLAVPLPWMSVHQLVIFALGAGVGSAAFLTIPIWFLLLGRHFPADPPVRAGNQSSGSIAMEVTP